MVGLSDVFKNISLNLRATGPAAVICVWIIAVALVAIFGSDNNGHYALTVLFSIGIILVISFGQKIQ